MNPQPMTRPMDPHPDDNRRLMTLADDPQEHPHD